MNRVSPADLADVREFLTEADLTLAGLSSASLWVDRDSDGHITATTGFELVGQHALIRSVAVRPDLRGTGIGLRFAALACVEAQLAGATTAWLFSRRSGVFWQKLGFAPASTDDLVAALGSTSQVQLFATTGQLAREVAWRRELVEH